MRNELQRHKRSDKVKWVLTGIMFFLAFVMIAGLILQVFGTGKAKPSEWFKKQDSEQTEELPAESGENATAHTRLKAMAAPLSVESGADDGIMLLADHGILCEHIDKGDSFSDSNYTYNLKTSSENFSVSFYLNGTDTLLFTLPNNYMSLYFEYHKATMAPAGQTRFDNTYYLYVCCHGFKTNIPERIEMDIESMSYKCRNTSGKVRENNVVYDAENDILTLESRITFSSTSANCYSVSADGTNEKFTVDCTFSLPSNPVKEGYTFVGWYYDEEFTRAYDGEPITAETQLYAKFKINTYTVTFDSNGGSGVESKTVDWNTSVELPISAKEDHTLLGWYYADGTKYENQPIKSDTALRAEWKKTIFLVTFDSNGGSEVAPQKHGIDTSINELPTTTRTGFTFVGWYLPNGTAYVDQPITEDMTLTAHWEIIMCKVTFYVDGEIYAEKTVQYGSTFQHVLAASNLMNLRVQSVRYSDAVAGDIDSLVVTDDSMEVFAEEMDGMDKAINTVKNNKWAIIGGVAGGVALIAIIAAACGGVKRKRRR